MGTVLSGLVSRMRRLLTGRHPSQDNVSSEQVQVDATVPQEFARHDENGDGVVTVDELERTNGDWWSYLGMDRNNDAKVSIAEYNAAQSDRALLEERNAKWSD